MSDTLTRAEVAKLLNRSPSMVKRYAEYGLPPEYRLVNGRSQAVYARAMVDEWRAGHDRPDRQYLRLRLSKPGGENTPCA